MGKHEGESRIKLAQVKIREWTEGIDVSKHPDYDWVKNELERLKIRYIAAPNKRKRNGKRKTIALTRDGLETCIIYVSIVELFVQLYELFSSYLIVRFVLLYSIVN